MPPPRLLVSLCAALLLIVPVLPRAPAVLAAQATAQPPAACPAPGTWVLPGAGGARPVAAREVIAGALAASVVLLGETHDDAEHHRWQLQVLAALHAQRRDLVLALEMFPRRVQPVLERWVAGELGTTEFLRLSDWQRVWGHDPEPYLPIFHFARMNRIPMLAINVDRELVRQVRRHGWDAVPAPLREGLSRPAPPSPEYVRVLKEVYAAHPVAGTADAGTGFSRFVEAQTVWDRAMAEALAPLARAARPPLLVVLAGSGHVRYGHGIEHQLRDLGIGRVYSMLPLDLPAGCEDTQRPAVADALFAIAPPRDARRAADARHRPRLGVQLTATDDGVRIAEVAAGSLAESSGLRAGDLIVTLAGRPIATVHEVGAGVRAQPDGTWLPLGVRRDSRTIEVIVKFPAPAP
jgi:uncharacterized iron-regulated protein